MIHQAASVIFHFCKTNKGLWFWHILKILYQFTEHLSVNLNCCLVQGPFWKHIKVTFMSKIDKIIPDPIALFYTHHCWTYWLALWYEFFVIFVFNLCAAFLHGFLTFWQQQIQDWFFGQIEISRCFQYQPAWRSFRIGKYDRK